MRFNDAVRAEILKVTTTRMWWIIALVMVVYVAFMGLVLGGSLGYAGSDQMGLAGLELAPLVYSVAVTVGYVFPLILGALSVTGEYRHQTITPSFLAVPRRGVALAAKGLVQLGLGAMFGVVAFAAVIASGGALLAASGAGAALGDPDIWLLVLRGVAGMALWGVIGVGFGALIRNQVAAIVVIIAITQFVEPILRSVAMLNEMTAQVANVLPGAASDALTGASLYQSFGMTQAELSWWAGGLILLGYAVVAAAAGYFVSWRRDVT